MIVVDVAGKRSNRKAKLTLRNPFRLHSIVSLLRLSFLMFLTAIRAAIDVAGQAHAYQVY